MTQRHLIPHKTSQRSAIPGYDPQQLSSTAISNSRKTTRLILLSPKAGATTSSFKKPVEIDHTLVDPLGCLSRVARKVHKKSSVHDGRRERRLEERPVMESRQ